MDWIVITLSSMSEGEKLGPLLFLGAQRMDAKTGVVSASLTTYIKPQPADMTAFKEWTGHEGVTVDELDSLPSAKEALIQLSHFAGADAIVAQGIESELVPLIRFHCERLGLATRPARFIDYAKLARIVLTNDQVRPASEMFYRHQGLARVPVSFSVRCLSIYFGLIEADAPRFGPLLYLRRLGQVVHRLWTLRTVKLGKEPQIAHVGVLPALPAHHADLAAIADRRDVPTVSHDEFVRSLKPDGLLPA